MKGKIAQEMPNGWMRATLGSIAVDDKRIAYGVLKPGPRANPGVPMLRVKDMVSGFVDDSEIYRISQELHQEFSRTHLRGGEIVISIQGTVGRIAIVPSHLSGANVSRTLAVVPLAIPDMAKWVWAMFQTPQLQDVARSLTGGTTRDSLNLRDLRIIEVPVAPTEEQHRIVEAIESYFTRLDDAVATLGRVQRNLKRYRASVLKAAVEGRLVPTEAELAHAEGRDYEPASALLERILGERRRRWEEAELAKLEAKGKTPKNDKWKARYKEPIEPDTADLPDLPEGWCWVCMDHFLHIIEAGKSFRCVEKPPESDQIGVVKVSSVTWGTFDEEESKTCTRPELVNSNYFIQSGDLLISRANTIELVGAVVIVGSLSKTLMLSDKILRLKTVGGLDRWLLWLLRSSHGRSEIERLATGNQDSMRNIGQANIRRIRIPLPPLSELQRIVEKIDEQYSTSEHAGSVLDSSVARCDRLRQSILKWAFEGKLVDQDPDDEPASTLLERIQAEREAAVKKKSKAQARRRTQSTKS